MQPSETAQNGAAERAAAGGAEKGDYVQQIFSEIAPRYDLLNHVLSLNVDRRWRRRALAALDWPRAPAGTYLDLCAGTLDVGAQLARTPGFAGFVVAADFAEPMLRAGAGKASHRILAPVTADVLRLRSATRRLMVRSWRLGSATWRISTPRSPTWRVLAPGARLVILEFSTPGVAAVRTLYQSYFHHVLPLVGRVVSGHPTAYTYLPRSVANFPAVEELAARIARAGFRDVSWQSLTFGIAAIHVGTK